ncbi:MAG: hypothetical protein PF484_01845 [Bacteroidales bacterium]|jgi:hypothetical protein|nr:hypothetical protein [Bacteroidales bacterium]
MAKSWKSYLPGTFSQPDSYSELSGLEDELDLSLNELAKTNIELQKILDERDRLEQNMGQMLNSNSNNDPKFTASIESLKNKRENDKQRFHTRKKLEYKIAEKNKEYELWIKQRNRLNAKTKKTKELIEKQRRQSDQYRNETNSDEDSFDYEKINKRRRKKINEFQFRRKINRKKTDDFPFIERHKKKKTDDFPFMERRSLTKPSELFESTRKKNEAKPKQNKVKEKWDEIREKKIEAYTIKYKFEKRIKEKEQLKNIDNSYDDVDAIGKNKSLKEIINHKKEEEWKTQAQFDKKEELKQKKAREKKEESRKDALREEKREERKKRKKDKSNY